MPILIASGGGSSATIAGSATQPPSVIPSERSLPLSSRASAAFLILASSSRTLYTGVTNDLARRLHQHRSGVASAFTRRYSVHRLVHVETSSNPRDAIARETQIKRWTRKKKVALIEANNPGWKELSSLSG